MNYERRQSFLAMIHQRNKWMGGKYRRKLTAELFIKQVSQHVLRICQFSGDRCNVDQTQSGTDPNDLGWNWFDSESITYPDENDSSDGYGTVVCSCDGNQLNGTMR